MKKEIVNLKGREIKKDSKEGKEEGKRIFVLQ